MTFKTKEEMFGDGGGYGAQVPISLTNPSGTGTGNRGIQFGEQLTAAIANRPHYALALNDEDLNTRLVSFESTGLDAAYYLGTAAVPGGGRIINKDAGAVETVTAHATTLGDTAGDPASFRANHLGDSVGIAVGFDVVSDRVGASGQSGNDAAAGFLDRRAFAKSSGDTILTESVAASTLNPGGAVATTVRLGTGSFHTSGDTDLILGIDMVQISGSGTFDGFYVITALGATDADAIVRRLDGTAPTFTGNTACTVQVSRPTFGTWGQYSSRTDAVGSVVAGARLALIPGAQDSADTEGGVATALSVESRDAAGVITPRMSVDFFGRVTFEQVRGDLITDLDLNLYGGGFATRRVVDGSGDVGHIVTSVDPAAIRADFLSLQAIDPAGVSPAVTPNTVTMAFVANSPITGEVRFNAAQDSDLWGFAPPIGTAIELTGGGDGLYLIAGRATTGNGGFFLRRLDGQIPAHLPVTGTATLVALYRINAVGHIVTFQATTLLDSGEGTPAITASNVFTASTVTDGVALALFGNFTNNDSDLIRGFRAASGSPTNSGVDEVFKVSNLGTIWSNSDVNIGGAFKYIAAQTRLTPVPLQSAVTIGTWSRASNPTTTVLLRAADDSIYASFPISSFLRDGQVVTDVKIIVNPGAARTSTDRVRLLLCSVDPNFSSAAVPTPVIIADEYDDTTTNLQIISLATSLGAGHTVDRLGTNGREYFVAIKSGVDASGFNDDFYGLELTITDQTVANV